MYVYKYWNVRNIKNSEYSEIMVKANELCCIYKSDLEKK